MCERVEIRIGSSVIGLASGTEDTGNGREQEEEIEWQIFGEAIEQGGAERFGRHDVEEPGGIKVVNHRIVENSG